MHSVLYMQSVRLFYVFMRLPQSVLYDVPKLKTLEVHARAPL